MVKEINGKFQCEQCMMFYPNKEIAQKCEDFCKENKSCNLDLIKHAVEE